MGREIRQVPLGWEHPKTQRLDPRTQSMVEQYQPMRDRDVETAMSAWLEEYEVWQASERDLVVQEHPEMAEQYAPAEPYRSFCDWNGQPPDPAYYRPVWPTDAVMGYAVYENVTEGTPITPTFATKEELVDYLATHGTSWDEQPWARAAAERFVACEYAPSFVIVGGTMIQPGDEAMYQLGE